MDLEGTPKVECACQIFEGATAEEVVTHGTEVTLQVGPISFNDLL